MAEVPKTSRYNELAGRLLKKVRALQSGSAIRVELKWWPKTAVVTAKKYGLEAGLRVGVRICPPLAYLWRLSDEEIKAVEAKASRMAQARQRRKKA